MKPKKYYTEKEVINLMISASRWGSHAYDTLYKQNHNCLRLDDFRRHRIEVIKDMIKK